MRTIPNPPSMKASNPERWQDRLTGFAVALALCLGWQVVKPGQAPQYPRSLPPQVAPVAVSATSAPVEAVVVSPVIETITEATPAPVASDIQVWVNTRSGIYHMPGTRHYGTTKEGEYLGMSTANARGYRAAANGQ